MRRIVTPPLSVRITIYWRIRHCRSLVRLIVKKGGSKIGVAVWVGMAYRPARIGQCVKGS